MENVYNVGGKTKGCDLLIEMKRASSQEYSLIDLFCQEEGLAPQEKTTDSAFFMIIKDGNALLGFAIVEADPAERATIKYLYIKKIRTGPWPGRWSFKGHLESAGFNGYFRGIY